MRKLVFLSFFIVVIQQFAHATPQSLSYQGRILDSLGDPLENPSVIFRFTLLSPDGTCELWTEDKAPLNMINSGGIFDLTIGPSADLATALENGTNHTCLNSGNYTGIATAGRLLKVEFNPGNGWREITPNLNINSVPYANVAAKLGNMTAGDFIARPGTCSTGQSVYFDGTNFVCQSLAAGDIPNIDADKITSGTLTTNVSSTTGQFTNLRIYDGVSQYITMNYPSAGATSYTVRWPATQGGASTVLQNDGAGNLSWAAAGSGTGDITEVAAGAGLTGGATTGIATLAVDSGLGANKIPVVGGAPLGASGVVVANGLGTALTSLNCTIGQVIKFDVSGFATCGTDDSGDSNTVLQGGNFFSAEMTIGTNDNFALKFETNASQRMTILNDGKVGVGVPLPAQSLDVSGTTQSTQFYAAVNPGGFHFTESTNTGMYLTTGGGNALNFRTDGAQRLQVNSTFIVASSRYLAPNGSAGSPSLVFSNDYDTGIFSGGGFSDVIGFSTAGTEKMRINGSGHVGILTPGPATALDVNGAVSQRGMAEPALSPAGQGRIYFSSADNKFKVSQNGSVYTGLVGSSSISGLTTNYLSKATSSTTIGNSAIYESSGNVGIATTDLSFGLGWLSNSKRLILSGDGSASNYSFGNFILANNRTTPATGDIIGQVLFISKNNGGVGSFTQSVGSIVSELEGTSGAFGIGSILSFSTRNKDNANTEERLRIDSSGRVGIGTPSPVVSLDLSSKTDAVRVPAGTTAQRPAVPANGDIRVNSTNGTIEAYLSSAWMDLTDAIMKRANITSTPYTITSSQGGYYLSYNNAAAGTINLPALSGLDDGWSVTVVRKVAQSVTLTPDGADTFANGVTTLEMRGQNIASITLMNNGGAWAIVNQTDDCIVGQSCWGANNIYVGSYNGRQYFTTPGGCTDSATPTCAGGNDTVQKAWATSAPESNTLLNLTNYNDGQLQSATLAGYATTNAAKYCENMSYSGYTDWYLPARQELSFLYQKSHEISGFRYMSNYWTSTETLTPASAWNVDSFSGDTSNFLGKTSVIFVRCIRRF